METVYSTARPDSIIESALPRRPVKDFTVRPSEGEPSAATQARVELVANGVAGQVEAEHR